MVTANPHATMMDAVNASTDLHPVQPGQAKVKDDDVWVDLPGQCHRLKTIAADRHLEALAFEVGGHDIGQRLLVLDNHRPQARGRTWRRCGDFCRSERTGRRVHVPHHPRRHHMGHTRAGHMPTRTSLNDLRLEVERRVSEGAHPANAVFARERGSSRHRAEMGQPSAAAAATRSTRHGQGDTDRLICGDYRVSGVGHGLGYGLGSRGSGRCHTSCLQVDFDADHAGQCTNSGVHG